MNALDVMVDVQAPSDWRTKAEEHRMMARAAIRVALRHGIKDSEIEREYEIVRQLEIEAAGRVPQRVSARNAS